MAENGMRSGGGGSSVGGVISGNGTAELDYAPNGHHNHEITLENGKPPRMSEAAQKYMQDLLGERTRMENHFPLAVKLIDEALERLQLNGRIPTREQYADVYQQRTIRLSQKVHVPIKDKKFNYVGKLLGPKGNSLRRLQEETQCKIVILGRFSMKDRVREEELRNSADSKYAHLNLPLHVEVSTIAPPAEAYARVAYALAEIRRYLIPDKHDDIRQEQFRELMEDPEAAKKISLRQQQQQQQQQQQHQQQNTNHHPINVPGGGGHGMGGNHRAGVNSGAYRHKYQQPQYHHNDETVYYRSNNNYHPNKPYVPAMRSNPIHSTMPQPAIVGASSSGIYVNSANMSARAAAGGAGVVTNNSLNVGGGGANGAGGIGGIGGPPNVRYHRQTLPFQFVKK